MSVETFRFTTIELPTGPVATYGLVGIPEGPGPHPAILHIHGGGQTASIEAVEEQVAHLECGFSDVVVLGEVVAAEAVAFQRGLGEARLPLVDCTPCLQTIGGDHTMVTCSWRTRGWHMLSRRR
jgi:hypothetical protein